MSTKRGRPPIAESVSQLPATTIPTDWHDALSLESIQRDVPLAQIVRESVYSHLKNRPQMITGSV